MKPELERSRTPEQLAELFRQLADEPLTSLMSAPVLRNTKLSDAGATAEDLLRVSGVDCSYVHGAEKNMLVGDYAFLIAKIYDKLQKQEYGTRTYEPLRLILETLLLFPIWVICSGKPKKGVRM